MIEFIITCKDELKPDGSYQIKRYRELVRCKDCKYNDDGECIIKAGWFPVKPDWFCADGERKKDILSSMYGVMGDQNG